MRKITDLDIAKKYIALYSSATTRNIEFNLTFKKVKQLLARKTCAITGVPFSDTGANARSIDRVDNDKGYVDDNVVACTIEINSIKGNLTVHQIECLYNIVNKFKKS